VLAQWRQFDPVFIVERYADALRRLSLLYIECGSSDEFNLHLGSRMLARRLNALDIAHRYEEFQMDTRIPHTATVFRSARQCGAGP